MAEARRMRLLEPSAHWIATPSGAGWRVARLPAAPGAKRFVRRSLPARDRPATRRDR